VGHVNKARFLRLGARYMKQLLRQSLPVAASTGQISQITGLAPTTIRRLERTDPSFPKPFRLEEGGAFRWPTAEVLAWLEQRAGRPLAA
jgi:predicted DNA-binding transcriptional regulator AlpA